MSNSINIVQIKNLTKVYKTEDVKTVALNGINLNIKKGDFIAITGRSGSGKSTLIHIIGLLDIPTSGSYLLNGADVLRLSEDRLAMLRNKEIGLRKALGAKRVDILKQFLLEAVILSLLGGIIGIILGLLASYILSLFLVSQVTPFSVILAFGFSVMVVIVFGMAPAIRASKLNPIDALRYE